MRGHKLSGLTYKEFSHQGGVSRIRLSYWSNKFRNSAGEVIVKSEKSDFVSLARKMLSDAGGARTARGNNPKGVELENVAGQGGIKDSGLWSIDRYAKEFKWVD